MRARLLIAFFGIAAFAVLAAAAGIQAFREVGERLQVIEARVPPTLSALELSRSAERIIAAAPSLLAASDRERLDEVKAELATEIALLGEWLLALKSESQQALPAETIEPIEPIVTALTSSLAALDDVVERRLEASERIGALRRVLFQASADVQRLLSPWLQVLDGEITALVSAAPEPAPDGSTDRGSRLGARLALQAATQSAQRQVAAVVDMLAEASTTDQPGRLVILSFQLGLALRDLSETTLSLDPKLQPLFGEEVARLRSLADGPEAIADVRALELRLADEGAEILLATATISRDLSDAVDRLGIAARADIGAAIGDAVAVQRDSTRILVALVALSFASSVLIAWLYVGRSIMRRLGELGQGMLAIAGGNTGTPVAIEGRDEIAAMARAVEVLRENTLERDRLLEEKAQAAERLERDVRQRTAELAQSVEELRALGEVSQAVNSSVELETVLTTIVTKATQLSDTEAGAIYVFDEAAGQFRLRATYGMDEAVIQEIREHQSQLAETALGEAAKRGVPIQVADVQADPSPVLDVIVRAGYRAVLFIPMRGAGRTVGALVVRRKAPGSFSNATIELLQTFAAQSVAAIQNARLFEEVSDKSHQLEVANKYKSHFLASASHDLRQPLHALNLFVAQLRTAADPGQRQHLVEKIDAAVDSMNELFESLLDMSKLEAGVLEPKPTKFPLERLLSQVEATFADAAAQKGLRLVVVGTTAWVKSDFVLLERIVFNLVSNAVRYTSLGGVVVGARRRNGDLCIDVVDTGPGIPPEQQQNVFTAYYSLGSQDRRGGLGLGLDIVARLVRLLGHRVELKSVPDKGSRFSVMVPEVPARLDEAVQVLTPPLADPAPGKLVLVIEDDPLVVDGMAGVLQSWGCEVMSADGEDGALLKVVAAGRAPDLIIADFRLAQGRTGIQAIERLRREAGHAIPAFLISGDTAPELLREAKAGGLHLLHKPVPPMRLRAMFNQLLRSDAPT